MENSKNMKTALLFCFFAGLTLQLSFQTKKCGTDKLHQEMVEVFQQVAGQELPFE